MAKYGDEKHIWQTHVDSLDFKEKLNTNLHEGLKSKDRKRIVRSTNKLKLIIIYNI